MAAIRQTSITDHFATIKDPRVVNRTDHLLVDTIVMAICAVIANCDDWEDIALFAKKRADFFKTFLALPKGIPSASTFRRVFAAINPRAFERCCITWLKQAATLVGLRHVAIDGKTLRGSAGKLGALHLVSAWATEVNLSLGQVAVDSKSNEITAIPELLDLLHVQGALVTIDAIGCQKEIASKIVAEGGDYVLTVKGNQERLQDDIQMTIGRGLEGQLPAGVVRQYETEDKGHGRLEKRSYVIVDYVKDIRDLDLWPGLKTVGMCCSERTVKGVTTTEVRYFIGSRRMSAAMYAKVLRGHWRIENCLHWQLDISFSEDASRIQDRAGAENFALLRRMALCLLKLHPKKDSIARKRKTAALDPDFLAEVLEAADNVVNI